MTVVVDASVMVAVLILAGPDGDRARSVLQGEDLHAPHLLDLEVASACRRLVSAGSLGSADAVDALAMLSSAPVTRYPHAALLHRVWELRTSCTAYDAAYVALAEALAAPLVTADARLARASGTRCAITLLD